MADALELESTLTDRYQTTVPDLVRKTLRLKKRDKIRYVVQPNGDVVMTRATPAESEDPVLGKFLQFLAADMETHPSHLRGVTPALRKRLQGLTRKVKFDPSQPLDPADDE